MEVKIMTRKIIEEENKKYLQEVLHKDMRKGEKRALWWLNNFNRISGLFPRETTISGDKENPLEIKYETSDEINKRIRELEERIADIACEEGDAP